MHPDNQIESIINLTDVPESSVGAPLPFVMSDEHRVLLAYLIQDEPFKFDGQVLADKDVAKLVEHVAVIEFQICRSYMFGSPGDETIQGYRLYQSGLRPYGAFEVLNSKWIKDLQQ